MNRIPLHVLVCWLSCTVLVNFMGEVSGQCTLNPNLIQNDKKNGDRGQNLLNQLNSLPKEFRNHPIEVQIRDRTYTIKICPDDKKTNDHSAFDERDSGRMTRRLGRMNESNVMISAFGDTLYLIYSNGDDYRNACNKTERQTITIVKMTSAVKEPTLFLTEESVGHAEDVCYHMFELNYPLNSEIGSILKWNSCEFLTHTTM